MFIHKQNIQNGTVDTKKLTESIQQIGASDRLSVVSPFTILKFEIH